MPTRPHRRTYAVGGALLSLGAPAGYLLLRVLMSARWPTPDWLLREITGHVETYVYLTVTTMVLLVVLGHALGSREDEAEALSRIDPLTGLANRRRLMERFEEEAARASRYELPLSVLVLDLDGLKSINDRQGHAAGDEALRRVAEALRRTCRSTDLAARFGGDEFVVLASATAAPQARELGRRIRQALAEAGPPRPGAAPPSVSIGVADAASVGQIVPETMLSAADAALYREKHERRALAIPVGVR